MVMCFAPTCKHYSERDDCKWFAFPRDPLELRKWLKLIRREDRDPGKHSRICSCHFVDGDKENRPTIFDYNITKRFKGEALPKKSHKHFLANVDINQPIPGPSGLDDQFEATTCAEEVGMQVSESTPSTSTTVMACSSAGTSYPFGAMVDAENYFLKNEVNSLKTELLHLKQSFSFKKIEGNSHLVTVYTGLPTKDIFLTLFSLFENMKLNYFMGWQVVSVPKIDQLLLTLMKLKLNLLNADLALRFNISRETVANIFKTWLFALHEILFVQLMKNSPSRFKNKCCMPNSFSSFTNCRMIIDCTEVCTIQSKNMEKQRITYSSYKHRNTLKGLIGVAPNGVVVFASKLYPGSLSDKKITEHCDVLQTLVPGDLILADKGFLISDLLPQGVSLNVPPFLNTPQFSREQVIRTKTIAKARIHVERAINRIKQYLILRMIPSTLIPHASVVFQTCAALTNLQFPLIKEVESLYD
ncbi:uncharacterized protein LOC116163533 [Photinus pyralis]|uniref:uncharacterized protein LOC116163533 n=1 Tax=Photinus pyralis TaxID=7054 RepID=UPI001266F7C3|nr:uncharacterized protein LOC116163533 [Photinus pyralis]